MKQAFLKQHERLQKLKQEAQQKEKSYESKIELLTEDNKKLKFINLELTSRLAQD